MTIIDPYNKIGSVYLHSSIKKLGRQGNESFRIAEPFLHSMARDCNLSLGSAPNQLTKGKDTLVINASTIVPLEGSFWQNLTKALRTKIELAPSQSSTHAVSPESIAVNSIRAKANLFGIDTAKFSEQFEEFFNRKEIKEMNEAYLRRYSIVPTKANLNEDLLKGGITAMQNGLLEQNSFKPFA